MEIGQFKRALKSDDFEQTINALRFALEDYSNGLNIDEYEEILIESLELNPKLNLLIDKYDNPFRDGDSTIYESNASMIEGFENGNYLVLSEQQEIFIGKLKNEKFFDIVAANSVIGLKPFLNEIKPEVCSMLSIDECKAIINVLDNNQNLDYDIDKLDLALKGMVKTASIEEANPKRCAKLFYSAVGFLNLNIYGLEFEDAYKVLIENADLNGKINSEVVEKIYEKVANPESNIKKKFNALELERLKDELEYKDFDDDDFEEKPAKRMKLKM